MSGEKKSFFVVQSKWKISFHKTTKIQWSNVKKARSEQFFEGCGMKKKFSFVEILVCVFFFALKREGEQNEGS